MRFVHMYIYTLTSFSISFNTFLKNTAKLSLSELNFAVFLFSSVHLLLIMLLDPPHCLWKSSCSAMQVIRMGCLMLMEYHTIPFCWVIRVMQIPIMPGILGLDGYIIIAQHNDVKILRIYFLKYLCIKHRLLPSHQTRLPKP